MAAVSHQGAVKGSLASQTWIRLELSGHCRVDGCAVGAKGEDSSRRDPHPYVWRSSSEHTDFRRLLRTLADMGIVSSLFSLSHACQSRKQRSGHTGRPQ